MNFLKSIWRKLFGVKTGVYESVLDFEYMKENIMIKDYALKRFAERPAYDPSQDPDRIMQGGFESYFD